MKTQEPQEESGEIEHSKMPVLHVVNQGSIHNIESGEYPIKEESPNTEPGVTLENGQV